MGQSISNAVSRLVEELNSDACYRGRWVDNISMSIQYEFKRDYYENGPGSNTSIKEIADKGAERFLSILSMNHNLPQDEQN